MSVTPAPKGTVQYLDSAWGGYRSIDAFGDNPTATFPRSKAMRVAREMARNSFLNTRVLTEEGEVHIRYRRRTAQRY